MPAWWRDHVCNSLPACSCRGLRRRLDQITWAQRYVMCTHKQPRALPDRHLHNIVFPSRPDFAASPCPCRSHVRCLRSLPSPAHAISTRKYVRALSTRILLINYCMFYVREARLCSRRASALEPRPLPCSYRLGPCCALDTHVFALRFRVAVSPLSQQIQQLVRRHQVQLLLKLAIVFSRTGG